MRNKVVISDTSCLIAFDRINRLDILQKSFNEIITTVEGSKEFGNNFPDWIEIRTVSNTTREIEFQNIVDKGEASAIALALETSDCILIIDEKKGRKLASELHIEIIGTLKILLMAKQQGLIVSVKEVILELEKANFRFSELIVKEILKLSGEE